MQPDEYHKMAAVEDAMWYYRALHRHVARSLTRLLGASAAPVLDAGCGTGGLAALPAGAALSNRPLGQSHRARAAGSHQPHRASQ